MLSSVLSHDDCRKCRFCCSFRRESLWETPLFDTDTVTRLAEKYPEAKFIKRGDACTINISDGYNTDDPGEEALCPFNRDGCILAEGDKPFDCSIWPLRVMRYDGAFAICLTPTCPVISEKPLSIMKGLADGNVGDRIIEYALEHGYIIKDYREGFPVLRKFS